MNCWRCDCMDCTTQTTLLISGINQNPTITLRWNFHAQVLSQGPVQILNLPFKCQCSISHLEAARQFRQQWCHSHMQGAHTSVKGVADPEALGIDPLAAEQLLCSPAALGAEWGRGWEQAALVSLGIFPRLISAEIRVLKYLYGEFHASV